VDDGTGTIECAFRTGEGEDKLESKASENRNVRLPAQANGPATTSASSCPLVPVGSVVNVQGKVRVKHNSRELYGDSIGLYSTDSIRENPTESQYSTV